MADNVLYAGVRSITDLMMMPGLINLDFADIKSIMEDKGKAIMGTGEAEGEDRAVKAAEQALSNPLLDDCSMHGAKGVLINITGGQDITLLKSTKRPAALRKKLTKTPTSSSAPALTNLWPAKSAFPSLRPASAKTSPARLRANL